MDIIICWNKKTQGVDGKPENLIQRIKTGENQETTKVIEINTDNGHLLDFNMDKLYISMIPNVLSCN